MQYYLSPTLGFLADGIHEIPVDAVPLTELRYNELKGQQIVWLDPSNPAVYDPAAITEAEREQRQAVSERSWRDAELNATQWLVARHRDEVDTGGGTALKPSEFTALLTYRQALRDWPAAAGFPDSAKRPAPPDWLAAALATT